MLRKKSLLILVGTASALLIAAVVAGSADEPPPATRLVFTQIPVVQGASLPGTADGRYPERSRLVALDAQAPNAAPVVLTEGFQAARAPEVSFDGTRLLFAGQQAAGDAWRIWEMRLDGSGVRPLTDGFAACTDPAYLPHGGIVFSARRSEDDERHALFTVEDDGRPARQITFHPASDGAPTLLRDGRVLFASAAADAASTMLGMRYDGTRADLFYRAAGTGRLYGKAWETADRRLILVEAPTPDAVGGTLVAVSEQRPLHARDDLAPDAPGAFHSAFPDPSGGLTVSYRDAAPEPFALHAYDPAAQRFTRLYADAAYHAVEPVWSAPRDEPMGFVSIVDDRQRAGWLYCLDADHSTLAPAAPAETTRSRRVHVYSPDGLLGEVPLEADGSFYVEVPADTPLRFTTVDADGRAVRGPSAWIWVRPNEQRGCIGCHEDRELAPENAVPDAITRPPVAVPLASTLAPAHARAATQDREPEETP